MKEIKPLKIKYTKEQIARFITVCDKQHEKEQTEDFELRMRSYSKNRQTEKLTEEKDAVLI